MNFVYKEKDVPTMVLEFDGTWEGIANVLGVESVDYKTIDNRVTIVGDSENINGFLDGTKKDLKVAFVAHENNRGFDEMTVEEIRNVGQLIRSKISKFIKR